MIFRTAAALFLALTPAAALADGHSATKANATIMNLEGENIGSAAFQTLPNGQVMVTISASGLSQGWHGVHVHETGSCDASGGFKSAGGHLAGSKQHGLMAEGGPHPGDLPNQMVQAGGLLVAEIVAPGALAVSGDSEGAMLDGDGAAIMIHSGRDDYTSQPGGAAGDRIACGVIEAIK